MTETPQELLARLTGFTAGEWKFNPGKGEWLGGFYADTVAVCAFGDETTYYPTAGDPPTKEDAAPDLHRELAAALVREAALRAMLESAKDYVEDAANGQLLYRGRAKISSMAVDDLALILDALELKP